MSRTRTTVNLSRRRLGALLSAGLLAGGVLLHFHASLLTALGWAGGFRFVGKAAPVYLAVGVALLSATWYWDGLDVRTAVLTALASLPIVFGAVATQPGGAIFTPLERVLLYGPVALGLAVGVAHARSRPTAVYLLIGCVCVVWAVLTGLVLQSAPRGPIGLYLLWNYAVAVVLAVPLSLVGRVTARPLSN